MEKLSSLSEYLLSLKLFLPERFSSEAESGKIKENGTNTGSGIKLYSLEYTSVLYFEEIEGDLKFLIAMILSWLNVHDDDREDLDEITWSGEVYDDDTSDLQINIQFSEEVHFVEVPEDETIVTSEVLTIGEKQYILADDIPEAAEDFDLESEVEK
jgi:hypothetical protein